MKVKPILTKTFKHLNILTFKHKRKENENIDTYRGNMFFKVALGGLLAWFR